jgi:hypothetical protein
MTEFERALTASIREEMERMTGILVGGSLDIRVYDRTVAGYHALRLVIEEFIPDIHKRMNDGPSST